ncbi:MAG: EAL domain-containing protein [Rhodoferax sp.]|nr:EAL domain-containing protein [Rhodoferax sp.]
MNIFSSIWRRWRNGLPLRYTVVLAIMAGVATPALLLLTVEQQLTEKSQRAMLEQGESALMVIGSVSIAEPMWVVDHVALEAAALRLLENPQVVAVRIEEGLANSKPLQRVREGYKDSLEEQTAKGRLHRRTGLVTRSGEPLGNLVIWFDATYGQSLLEQRRSQMLVLVAIQVLVSVGVLIPVLVSRVLRPIERLKAQASALVEDTSDQPPATFVWKRHDEIGLLGQHLGRVQQQLRELFGQLGAKNAQLEQLALYDHLTGLPNRSLFIDLVQREILQARRSGQKFGIFFIDLDRFKVVNDTMGHAAGDALLMEVSRRLRDMLREIDVVCRQSGDEFLVLARDIAHWESLAEMADRVLQSIEQPLVLAGGSARVSASIGISLFPDDAQDFETLVKNADVAMYQAKSLGRARYSFFHAELNTRMQATMELEHQLGEAISGGQLVLHYQPQVDANTGSMVGVEALVRWQHPQRGLLYPGHFITIAEESGQIAEMGVWTLNEACRQKAAWKAQGLDVGCMSVNVSALEFRDHRLLDSLQTALQVHGLEPGELEIEITESVLMTETDTSQRIIERVRALGVGIAIDDFGTGYSSLSYLKRLRPNQLKIDRSFVSDTATDNDSRAIVKGVISLADALGLTVVAEGVETAQQLMFLRECGCGTLQGYYIAKPLTVEGLQAWMQDRNTDSWLVG